jgi:hypothetical protein
LPNPISTFASHAHYFPFPRNCDASNKAIAISFPAFPAGTPHTAPPLTVGATVTPFLLLCHRDPSPAPPGSGNYSPIFVTPPPPEVGRRGAAGARPLPCSSSANEPWDTWPLSSPSLPPLRRHIMQLRSTTTPEAPSSKAMQFASLLSSKSVCFPTLLAPLEPFPRMHSSNWRGKNAFCLAY